jgi:hypothetical protein
VAFPLRIPKLKKEALLLALTKLLAAANARMIDGWRREIMRLWSLRVALIWITVGAVIFVAPMISDEAKALIGAWPFAGGLFLASVSFGLARILKQPGTDANG